MIAKEYIRKILYQILSVATIIITKKKQVFIYGDYHLSPNTDAMGRYLAKHLPADIRLVCMTNRHMDWVKGECEIKFVKYGYFKAVMYMLTSDVVIESSLHTIKLVPSRKQFFIQLFHGMPLKWLTPCRYIKNGKYYSCILLTSNFFKESFLNLFSGGEEKFLIMGQPRSDYLNPSVETKELLGTCRIHEILNNKMTNIIWLPTYRQWGNYSATKGDIPIISKDNSKELDDFLRRENVNLYIKPHPLQSRVFDIVSEKNIKNIKLISDEILDKSNVPLYYFIGNMDALITDYSSVYYDYLLLDRPIGFAISDFDEYRNNVGFIVDEPFELMPGQKIYNISQLEMFINDVVVQNDKNKSQRKKINDIVNSYQENDNCKQWYKIIVDKMNQGQDG